MANSNSNFEFATKRGLVPITLAQTFRLKLCWRWGAACSMPRVSGIDDACGISAHHMFLSNCVMQVMRVWSLPAFLSPLAKQHIRYGVTQRTAYRISNGVCGGMWYKVSCAYIWVPFQLRRSLVAFGIDLPITSVHGAGAYDAQQRRLHATRRSGTQFMVTFVSGVRYIRSERARSRPTPGGSSAFRQHAAIARLRTRH